MNNKKIITIILLLIVIIGGSAYFMTKMRRTETPIALPQENTTTTKVTPTLSSATWVWQKTTAGNTVTTPQKANVFTLTFDISGRLSGGTDCNNFGGSYTAGAGNKLVIGELVSTLMFCENSQEGVFTSQIQLADRYSFDSAGNLMISLKSGSGTMEFKKK